MAYLIFTANGEEFDRRELAGPVTMGRARDCDICIPDITLSRHHCRLEPDEGEWTAVDLHSKNGTHMRGRTIAEHALNDGDELRIGRTRVTYREGAFVPASAGKRRGLARPRDPEEALAGTVTGMVLCEPGEVEKYEGMPFPQPRPTDPGSYAMEDIYGMISEIASSSWDSIKAQNSQPIRMQQAAPVPAMTRPAVRPKARVAFSLQAQAREAANPSPPPAKEVARPRPRWKVVAPALLGAAMIIATWVALLARSPSGIDERPSPPPPAQTTDPVEPITWDAVAVLA